MEGRDITDKTRERTKLYADPETRGKAKACRGNGELGDVTREFLVEVAWGEAWVNQTGLNSYI